MSSPEETWYTSERPSLMSTSSAKQRSPQNQERDFSSDDDDEHAPGVIETGKEHTGRWTRAEHQAFLFALQQYGKEWKKVAAHVKTRTVVQTRTHAQKYFQKLQKGLTNTQGQVRMEASIEAQKMLPIAAQKRSSSAKKKSSTRNSLLLTPAISSNLKQETEATQAAAHLMSQMARSSTPGDTNQIARAIDPYANPQVSYATPFHSGFSGRADNTSFSYATPQMKITVPRPDFASERHMFPEPSPAACGKRKVLELETANTLLGVVSSGGASFSSLSKDISRKATPPPTNPSNFGESGNTGMIELRKEFSSAKSAAPGGEGLHIVNPDNFPHERTTLRQGLGYEPTTPWDIELEALNR
jgi:SHAQKYF class myb-like DNA-binding protein